MKNECAVVAVDPKNTTIYPCGNSLYVKKKKKKNEKERNKRLSA